MNEQTNKDKDILYILKNITMPGYTRIGVTSNLREHLKDMDTKATILPHTVVYAGEGESAAGIYSIISFRFNRYKVEHIHHLYNLPAKYFALCMEKITKLTVVTHEYTPEKIYSQDVALAMERHKKLQSTSYYYDEMEEKIAMQSWEYEGESIHNRFHRILSKTIDSTLKEIEKKENE